MTDLLANYEQLLAMYGEQGWWPVTPDGGLAPRYGEPVRTERQRLEIGLGAILTQNTSWKNVEKALVSLNRHGLVDRERLSAMSAADIAPLIRSAGYFNQKAKKIKAYLAYEGPPDRDGLLGIWGLGPETVDSILLYAHGEPRFVVDAYTRRYFTHLGVLSGDEPYDAIREMIESSLVDAFDAGRVAGGERDPALVRIYKEYHALIVAHAKRYYSRKPYGVDDPTLEGAG